MISALGLSDHGRQRPAELSGGQQQRVGLARALIARPDILIADEPTAQLDSVTAAAIMDLISDLVNARSIAAVVSTHHAALAARATRIWDIRGGQVSEQPAIAKPTAATTVQKAASLPANRSSNHGRHAAPVDRTQPLNDGYQPR